jgi:hypothetical protein
MSSKATLAERAATIRAEREASFKTPMFPARDDRTQDEIQTSVIPTGLQISNGTAQGFQIGKSYMTIHQVYQRLRECGIVGNRDTRTGRRLDLWSVDFELRVVHAVTPEGSEPLASWERQQQTHMIGYIVASLAVDCPRAFHGVRVEIDDVTAEVRLVEVAS